MRLHYTLCDSDDQLWEAYLLLLMAHYDELTLPYDFEMSLSFIGDPILRGDALLARDERGTTVGVLGFVLKEEERACQVEALYLCEPYRRTAAFHQLLRSFVTALDERYPLTDWIRFWSPADRPDLSRLFGKFSRLVRTSEKSFGRIDLFETGLASLRQYTMREGPKA